MTPIGDFKKHIKADVLSCPDPILERELRTIMLEFCKKSWVLKKEFELEIDANDIDSDMQDSIDFDVSEYAYGLKPSHLVAVMIDSNIYMPYRRNIRNTTDNFRMTVEDDRYQYFWIPSNSDYVIRLFDMSANSRKVWMDVAFKPLRDFTEVDDIIYEDWLEAIQAGVKYRLLQMPGKDWTDVKASRDYYREWRRFLSQAKKEAIKGGSANSQYVNWQSFGEIDPGRSRYGQS